VLGVVNVAAGSAIWCMHACCYICGCIHPEQHIAFLHVLTRMQHLAPAPSQAAAMFFTAGYIWGLLAAGSAMKAAFRRRFTASCWAGCAWAMW
jgi:hypothetical protein